MPDRKNQYALKVKKSGRMGSGGVDTSSLTKNQKKETAGQIVKDGKASQKKATDATRRKHLNKAGEMKARNEGRSVSRGLGGKANNKAELFRSANKAQAELKNKQKMKMADKRAKSRQADGKAKTVNAGIKKKGLNMGKNFKGAYGGKK